MGYNTILYSTVQYNAVQYSTIHYTWRGDHTHHHTQAHHLPLLPLCPVCDGVCGLLSRCTVLYCTVLYSTVMYRTVPISLITHIQYFSYIKVWTVFNVLIENQVNV